MRITRRTVGGIVAGLLLGGVLLGILVAMVPGPLRSLLLSIETVLPTQLGVGGVVLVLLALALFYLITGTSKESGTAPLSPVDNPPEWPSRPPSQTGSEFDAAVDEAARAIRVEYVPPGETIPYRRLREMAVSLSAQAHGVTESAAQEIVSEGEWTEDTVAAAFLGSSVTYPRLFRVFRWARPELAYERAVVRTTQALHTLADAELSGYAAPAHSLPRDSGGDGRNGSPIARLRRFLRVGDTSRGLGGEASGPAPGRGVSESPSEGTRTGRGPGSVSPPSSNTSRQETAEVSTDE